MPKTTYRIVTRGPDGGLRIRDFPSSEFILQSHIQIGVDDCSTDLELRGLPVFRGLVGPMPEGKHIIRYESPEVFESLTKEWSVAKAARRTRRRTAKPTADAGFVEAGFAEAGFAEAGFAEVGRAVTSDSALDQNH